MKNAKTISVYGHIVDTTRKDNFTSFTNQDHDIHAACGGIIFKNSPVCSRCGETIS